MLTRKLFNISLLLILSAVLLLTGCSSSNNSTGQAKSENGNNAPQTSAAQSSSDPRADWPKELVISAVPSEDEAAISRRYEPLIAYLEEKLGIPVKIYVGSDYTASIEAMRNKHVHVGFFGPFSYILAADRARAEAFATTIKNGKAHYNSIFITLEGSGIDSLEDLQGRTLGWVDPASTSGHLFPKAHLINQLGLTYDNVDEYFSSVMFTGGHDSSFISVINGDIDAAPVSDSSYASRVEQFKDHPNIDKLKIFATTDDIPRSPVALDADLPENLKEEIKQAFYDVINVPELAEFVEDMSIQDSGYVPVEDSRYDVIRMTTEALGMDPAELMNE